jgi:hypothetical protein
VFAPGKSPVEVQPEILDIILLRKMYVVYVDWRGGFFLCECDMDHLGFISFYLPFQETCLNHLFFCPNCAGWFRILKVLFAGGGGCSVPHVLIMGHWGIQVALDFEVCE